MTLQTCDTTRPLIPRYLDGELAEPEAGPLRRHLLACQGCRTATQSGKALRRWFEAEAEVPVPQGFASRVARLAFAGALPDSGFRPAGGASGSYEAAASSDGPAGARVGTGSAPREDRILPFVLRLTAAAALLLIVLSGFMREVHIASGDDLSADDATMPTLEELDSLLERLEASKGDEALEGAPGAPGDPAR